MAPGEADVVEAFNDAINQRDLERLVALMAPGHRFVDAAGSSVEGREPSTAAWASFFEAFPDYRNHFERIELVAPGRVVVDGHSTCSFEALQGPARWCASIAGGLVVEWRVEEPPPPR